MKSAGNLLNAGVVDAETSGARAFFSACLRSFLAAAVIFLAVGVGLILPWMFRADIAELSPAGIALGAAAILAVFRQLIESTATLWEYVVSGIGNSLPKLFVQISIAALGVGFAYYSANPSVQTPLTLTVSGSLPPVILNESGSLLTSYVIFGEKKSTLSAASKSESDGLARVQDLVDSLISCIQKPSDHVNIVVRAFASSSGTDEDNKTLYNGRATFVRNLIMQDAVAKNPQKARQITISVASWPTFQAMEFLRLFRDTNSNGAYVQEAGAMNRRAEIRVLSAGSCYEP